MVNCKPVEVNKVTGVAFLHKFNVDVVDSSSNIELGFDGLVDLPVAGYWDIDFADDIAFRITFANADKSIGAATRASDSELDRRIFAEGNIFITSPISIVDKAEILVSINITSCLLYTSPSPRD